MNRGISIPCLVIAFACQFGGIAAAQQFQIAIQRGPYYVGEPVVVQVVAEGITSGNQPICRLADSPPASLTVDGPQVSAPLTSRSIQIINGRMTRRESANYRFNFVVTAREEGEFSIGPFEVEIDGQTRMLEATSLRFGRLENDPDMQISISLPRTSLFVGERIPVTIRWAFAGQLADSRSREAVQYAFQNLQIRSPLFDQFTFKDKQPSSRTRLAIATAKGTVEIDAEITQQEQDGRDFVVLTGQRILSADSAGDFQVIPVSCRTTKVTGWGRDLFGDLRAAATAPALAAGEPVGFTVRPLPAAGRPESFAGAVGNGFSMDVAANRTVVRVGDPISLNVTLRGDGNLDTVSLPPLWADGGMAQEQFQFPSEQPAGSYDGKAKQFKVSVRVTDKSVSQIPALAFSWFDPAQEKYATARSAPIALQVMPAQVVSAKDVVSSPVDGGDGNQAATGGQDQTPAGPTNVAGGISLDGANLAIETDSTKLLAKGNGLALGTALLIGPYIGGLAVVFAAVLLRRRADVDPELARRQRELKQRRKQIVQATQLPPREAGQQIASALRKALVIGSPTDNRPADELIKECETLVYAPSADVPRVSMESLASRALTIFDEITG